MWYQAISSKWPLFLSVLSCCCFPTCFWLQISLCCLSQPGRFHLFLLFLFLFFFFATQGWILSHLLKLIFLTFFFLSQKLNYLLFIPVCLSAAINPLPVRDQDPSMYHLIIIFGSFPNLSFSPLKSVPSILQALWYSSISSSQFLLNPRFYGTSAPPGPIFKTDIGEKLWKASGSFYWLIFALNSMRKKKNFVIKRGCSSVCHFYVNSVFTIPQCSAFSFAWNLKGIFFFFCHNLLIFLLA